MAGITGIDADDWDKRIYGPVVIPQDDGTYRLYYTGYTDNGLIWHPCMATSPDMINWTKPNLGLVDFNGSTDNNILLDRLSTGPTTRLNLTDIIRAEGMYVMATFDANDTSDHVYYSADGITGWTFGRQIFSSPSRGVHTEIKGLIFIDDVYRVYYAQHDIEGVGNRRSIGYYELNELLTGSMVDKGIIEDFTSVSNDLQYYDFLPFEYAGSVWASVAFYNSDTQVLGPLGLFRNNYGGKGTSSGVWQQKGNLILNGDAGAFDEKMTTVGRPVLKDGTWKMLYTASDELHDTWPRDMFLAYATASI